MEAKMGKIKPIIKPLLLGLTESLEELTHTPVGLVLLVAGAGGDPLRDHPGGGGAEGDAGGTPRAGECLPGSCANGSPAAVTRILGNFSAQEGSNTGAGYDGIIRAFNQRGLT